jgi:hypothetical protein
MKMLSAKMNKERRFNKHFASCLIINKNGRTELIGPKQMDNSLCQQSENGSVEETLTTTKNMGNQSVSQILEEIRISNQTLYEMEQIKHMEEDTDKLGLTLFEMEQKPHVVNCHEIKLTMISETLDLNDKCLKAETIPQIGEKYLASQTMEDRNSRDRLGCHDQESQAQESQDQESKDQESQAQESQAQESQSQVQESHVQESHVQEGHIQESHVQESHNQESHIQESHVQVSHDQESHAQESHVQESHIQESHDHKSQAQARIKVNDINKDTKSNTILKGLECKTDSKENEVTIKTEDSTVHMKEMVTKKGLRVMDTNSNNCNLNKKDLSLNNSNSANGFQIKNENNKTLMNTNSNDCNLNKKESSMKKSNLTFAFQMKNENNKVIDRVSDLRKIRRPSKVSKCSN